MSFRMKVECPRCGRIWTIEQGCPGIACVCHLYCSEGDKPSDCTVTKVSGAIKYGWPSGLHVDAEDEGDDLPNRVSYCSTHNKYIYKTPVYIEADWERWFGERAPKKLRMSHGNY